MTDDELRRWPDGVETRPAGEEALEGYREQRKALAQLAVPVLVGPQMPHARLYIAGFDGTGNDKYADPEHATNVANVVDQIR